MGTMDQPSPGDRVCLLPKRSSQRHSTPFSVPAGSTSERSSYAAACPPGWVQSQMDMVGMATDAEPLASEK